MSIFVEVNLGCKRPEPFQRRIAETVQLEPGNRIRPTNNLVEDGEMCKASDTTAANRSCALFTKLAEPSRVVEKAQGKPLKRL